MIREIVTGAIGNLAPGTLYFLLPGIRRFERSLVYCPDLLRRITMPIFKKRDDDLVRLATFQQPMDAHSLKILLESNEISASVTGEESNATFGILGLGDAGMVGVQVLVQRTDYDDALLVMQQLPAAFNDLIAQWVCRCGETVDQGFSVCWSCGEPHATIT